MSDGLVRLVWEVDPHGYEIVRHDVLRDRPYPVRVVGKHRVVESEPLRRALMWDRLEARDDAEFIVPRGGKPRRYEAALLEHCIFLDLANSARRPGPDGVLEFVNKWGGLTHSSIRPLEGFLRERDALVRALDHADEDIAPLFNEVQTGSSMPTPELGSLHAHAVRKGGRSRVFFVAETLLQFCTLELLQTRNGGIDITVCGGCGEFLPLPKKGRPKLYCNDACKMAAYRTRHGDELNRARRQKRAKRRRAA